MSNQIHQSRRYFLQTLARLMIGWLSLPLLPACSPYDRDAVVVNILSHQPQAYFDPASVTIEIGTQVVWHNTGVLVQTITCDPQIIQDESLVQLPDGAEPWDSGALYTGEVFEYVFNTPGNYLYTSRYQPRHPLVGLISVRETG